MVVYRYSVTFDAPINFVYEWCTDYREDDRKIMGANYRRIILEKNKRRVIYASNKKGLGRSNKTCGEESHLISKKLLVEPRLLWGRGSRTSSLQVEETRQGEDEAGHGIQQQMEERQ